MPWSVDRGKATRISSRPCATSQVITSSCSLGPDIVCADVGQVFRRHGVQQSLDVTVNGGLAHCVGQFLGSQMMRTRPSLRSRPAKPAAAAISPFALNVKVLRS